MVRGTVRNVSSFGTNTKPIPVIHVIPPGVATVTKILVVTSDDVEHDVTDLVEQGSYNLGTNEDYIGSFNFKIIDPDQELSGVVAPYDEVKVYFGYVDGLTIDYFLAFRGKIEKPFRDDFFLVVRGRGIGMVTLNRYITYSASQKKVSEILEDIISLNFPDLSVASIEENPELRTVSYSEKAFSEIVTELTGLTYQFYIDQDLVVHYFEKGTRQCITEAISEDVNHIGTSDFGPNAESLSTKVRVYGKEVSGIQVFASSEEDKTLTKGVSRELKVVDKSVESTNQAEEYSNVLFNVYQDVPNIGSVQSTLLPSLKQGEDLYIAVPRDGLTPGFYKVAQFEHTFPDEQTTISIEKREFDLVKALNKSNSKTENVSQLQNPFDLDFCQVISYEVDSGSHNGTKVDEDKLLLQDGESSGQWESDTITLTRSMSEIWFRVSGENLSFPNTALNTRLWFSTDGGGTWTLFNPNAIPVVPLGNELKIRIVINSSNTRVSAVGIQYSLVAI
jgi:hypothetical protein